MTEVELNALFNICPEKEKNVYMVNTVKNVEEIQRIVRTFTLAKKQKETTKAIGAIGLAAFRTILTSNN